MAKPVVYSGGKEFRVPRSGMFAPNPESGYDVKANKLGKGRAEEKIGGLRNGELHDGSEWIKFFSQEISLSAGLSGSTGQGRYVRDFYAHNLKIPSLVVNGEALNQEEYSTIIEFIHQSQIRGVQKAQPIQLTIAGGGSNVGRSMKGRHDPIEALGYVKSVKRKHERFIPAPEFSFEFVLAKMEKGIFHDAIGEDPPAKNWLEIIEGLIEHKVEPTTITKVAGERAVREADQVTTTITDFFKGF